MRFLPQYRISELFERNANNLDLLRLICSILVIYGHAFVIAPTPGFDPATWDPSLRLGYAGVYCGSIAVKVFFFISGLLVTNSLLTKCSVSAFVIARFFRIWPALLVTAALSAFVVGPVFSAFAAADYFRCVDVYYYVFGAAIMHPGEFLPAVFAHNPLPHNVNGTLWTLGYEVLAYLALLVAALLGVLQRKALCAVLLLALMVDAVTAHRFMPPWFDPNPQILYLPACFVVGAFLAIMKDSIVLSPALLGTLLAGFIFLRHTAAGPLLFFLTVFAWVLYACALPWVRRMHLPADLSYGLYLWGFVVQQMIAAAFPSIGFLANFAAALAISVILAGLSWRLVEYPALQFGRRLAENRRRQNPAIAPASGAWELAG